MHSEMLRLDWTTEASVDDGSSLTATSECYFYCLPLYHLISQCKSRVELLLCGDCEESCVTVIHYFGPGI